MTSRVAGTMRAGHAASVEKKRTVRLETRGVGTTER